VGSLVELEGACVAVEGPVVGALEGRLVGIDVGKKVIGLLAGTVVGSVGDVVG
jgi:hypothetical protein